MRKLYWRPPGVSRRALLLIALVAVAALVAVESLPIQRKQPLYDKKIAAARIAGQGMRVIKNRKLELGIPIDAEADPAGTGLIGSPITAVTSNTGYLSAKRTTANPNFAAVVVDLLRRVGVSKGDTVAMGQSGSFPGLNLCTYAAIQALELKPIIITSVASSEWGANHVNYMWVDMEKTLVDRSLMSFRSIAASRGGIDDRGYGMSQRGRALLDAAIKRNELVEVQGESMAESIERRMELYDEYAKGKPIRAYINVGGGSASVGTHVGKKQFEPGLNRELPRGEDLVDSVMVRFLKRDVPVIHLTRIATLAKRYGLPQEPKRLPRIGDSTVFVKAEYNRWLAIGGLLCILGSMLAFIRWDVGLRLLRGVRTKSGDAQPQQMI